MEPFSIACTTCHARLKVRDPAAIGQILACPKCGSMVLIALPAGMPQPKPTAPPAAGRPMPPRIHASDSDSMADTVSGSFDDLDSLLPETGGAATIRAARAARANESPARDAASQSEISKNTSPANAAVAPEAAHDSPADTGDDATESIAPPSPLWNRDAGTSPAIRQFRQIMLLIGAACLGIVLALIVFSLIIARWGKPAVAVSGNSPDSSTTAVTPRADTETGGETPRADTPDADAVVPGPDMPAKPGDDDTPSSKPHENKTPPVDNGATPTPADAPPDLRPVEAPESPADLSGLDKFRELLNGGRRPKMAETGDSPAAPDNPRDEPPREASLPRPPQRKVQVAARLADKLPQVEYDVPLADFVQEMSNLTNIPISFDMSALVVKQVGLNHQTHVRESNASVEAILRAALEPLKLGLVATDNHLLVTWPSRETTNARDVKHAVADLVGNDPQQLELFGQWIVELIAPETWESAGGPGSLKAVERSIVVTNSDAVQQQVLLFFEKLRQARGLPPAKWDAERLKSISLATRATKNLTMPITLNFTRPTHLSRILDRLAKASDTRIAVDWKAAADAGWNPDATVTFVVDDKPLTEALATLLTPMDLAFRVIDDSTLQVTTDAALANSVDLEFHPVADLAQDHPQPLIERITATLGETVFRDAGGIGVIYWDAPSHSLLAALPPPQQQALATFLAALRAEAARGK